MAVASATVSTGVAAWSTTVVLAGVSVVVVVGGGVDSSSSKGGMWGGGSDADVDTGSGVGACHEVSPVLL